MSIISVVVGSVREGRFSEKPAHWIVDHLKKRQGVDARLLDLLQFPMPFFDQQAMPSIPGRANYSHPVVQQWTRAVADSDGFVFVTPEYNHGPPAVLKNALDWVYSEWHRKPAAFVSFGGVGGARSVEQLRTNVIELQMAPVRTAVHLPGQVLMAHFTGKDVNAALAELDKNATAMIDDLMWWVAALKAARQQAT